MRLPPPLLLCVLFANGPADAHPVGGSEPGQALQIHLGADRTEVRWTLELHPDLLLAHFGDGQPGLDAAQARLPHGLHLYQDDPGQPIPLEVSDARWTIDPADGTTRQLTFDLSGPALEGEVGWQLSALPVRPQWYQIILTVPPGVHVADDDLADAGLWGDWSRREALRHGSLMVTRRTGWQPGRASLAIPTPALGPDRSLADLWRNGLPTLGTWGGLAFVWTLALVLLGWLRSPLPTAAVLAAMAVYTPALHQAFSWGALGLALLPGTALALLLRSVAAPRPRAATAIAVVGVLLLLAAQATFGASPWPL